MRNQFRKSRNPVKMYHEPLPMVKIALKGEYWKNGRKFLTKFKTRFYKVGGRTFAVDIKKSAFEAPFAVSLLAHDAKSKKQKLLFEAKLDFKPKVITVVLQGGRGVYEEIRQFEGGAGMPAANFLCALIEKEAKEIGFKQVQLKKPQGLGYYGQPVLTDELKRTSRGKWAARLYLSVNEPTDKAERAAYQQELQNARGRIQRRMRRLVTGVAGAREYIETEEFFVKDL